jgi:predicted nucleic acid-binding protein
LPELIVSLSCTSVSTQVYNEVVVDGAGLPGATLAAQADWIEMAPVRNTAGLAAAIAKTGLGAGEVSAVFLAKEQSADLVLIDDWRARRYANQEALSIIGCVGILEDLHGQGFLLDLSGAYQRLIQQKTRIDLKTLQNSLAKFKLLPL